jgi:hypothetical protein
MFTGYGYYLNSINTIKFAIKGSIYDYRPLVSRITPHTPVTVIQGGPANTVGSEEANWDNTN